MSELSREELERREQIQKQIQLLQSELNEPAKPPKRKSNEPATLVPSTPSPRKKRKIVNQTGVTVQPRTLFPPVTTKTSEAPRTTNVRPSNLVSNMASLSGKPQQASDDAPSTTRSTGFAEAPAPLRPARDDQLVLIEEFEPGPKEFTPPLHDPNFEKLEPNSGIRLTSRELSHEDLQDYLRGRYYISPSRLYSCIRLTSNKQGFDVPVDGDWVTIAVVAERGPLKYTKPPVALGPEHENTKSKDAKEQKPTGRKYINIKLVDFGSRTHSSASGGKGVIGGDAMLSLLLFEAETVDLVEVEGQKRAKKIYRGGSKGAFESLAKVKEGDVIALLNPKILKPFQRSMDNPHPVHNILAITPESAASIVTIGRSKDFSVCGVTKKDGNKCMSWCDSRRSPVCEYHLQQSVQHTRSQRAEFSVGTSGMGTSAASKRKAKYDPQRKWGLAPEAGETGSTYVMSGHVIGAASERPDMFVAEKLGRDGQAKARRKAQTHDTLDSVKALMTRKGKGKEIAAAPDKTAVEVVKIPVEPVVQESRTRFFSANVVKQMGFNPLAGAQAGRDTENSASQRKLAELSALQKTRKSIDLRPLPGPKIRSCVSAPTTTPSVDTLSGMIDLDDF